MQTLHLVSLLHAQQSPLSLCRVPGIHRSEACMPTLTPSRPLTRPVCSCARASAQALAAPPGRSPKRTLLVVDQTAVLTPYSEVLVRITRPALCPYHCILWHAQALPKRPLSHQAVAGLCPTNPSQGPLPCSCSGRARTPGAEQWHNPLCAASASLHTRCWQHPAKCAIRCCQTPHTTLQNRKRR